MNRCVMPKQLISPASTFVRVQNVVLYLSTKLEKLNKNSNKFYQVHNSNLNLKCSFVLKYTIRKKINFHVPYKSGTGLKKS
jgi:hypothetical protein